MGKFKMGRDTDNPSKHHNKNEAAPQIIEVEKIVEVPVEKIIEVEKIVEVPSQPSEKSMDMPDLSQIYDDISKESNQLREERSKEISKLQTRIMKSIDTLGKSSAESFNVVFTSMEKDKEVINNQGALLVTLKDMNNKKSEQIIKLQKANKTQMFINGVLILGIVLLMIL